MPELNRPDDTQQDTNVPDANGQIQQGQGGPAPEPPSSWNPDLYHQSEQHGMAENQPDQAGGCQPDQPYDYQPNQAGNPSPYYSDPNTQPEDEPVGYVGKTQIRLSQAEAYTFESARKYISTSQICAVVSLFFGGVLLSTVALILAIIGYRKLKAIAVNRPTQTDVRNAIIRSGIVAIVMCAIALGINAISLIVLYPMYMQAIQSGDLSGLFGSGNVSSPSTGSSSTWG